MIRPMRGPFLGIRIGSMHKVGLELGRVFSQVMPATSKTRPFAAAKGIGKIGSKSCNIQQMGWQ